MDTLLLIAILGLGLGFGGNSKTVRENNVSTNVLY